MWNKIKLASKLLFRESDLTRREAQEILKANENSGGYQVERQRNMALREIKNGLNESKYSVVLLEQRGYDKRVVPILKDLGYIVDRSSHVGGMGWTVYIKY